MPAAFSLAVDSGAPSTTCADNFSSVLSAAHANSKIAVATRIMGAIPCLRPRRLLQVPMVPPIWCAKKNPWPLRAAGGRIVIKNAGQTSQSNRATHIPSKHHPTACSYRAPCKHRPHQAHRCHPSVLLPCRCRPSPRYRRARRCTACRHVSTY